jgi:hypothetical protein
LLLVIMPTFFLRTGLRTNWDMGGSPVFLPIEARLKGIE